MSDGILLLVTTTAGVALAHTLLGPDHYLPFIAMVRARQWTRAKALRITLLCGLGHIAASLGLGFVGIGVGVTMAQWTVLEGLRGSVAAWVLILFGLGYGAWGLRRALRRVPHSHWHAHADGSFHQHEHRHEDAHVHVHELGRAGAVSAWAIFAVFILGPCEPLIPLLLAPAAAGSPGHAAVVASVFTVVTLASMLGIVGIATAGVVRAPALPGARFGHAFAGAIVCCCGVAMQFGGL